MKHRNRAKNLPDKSSNTLNTLKNLGFDNHFIQDETIYNEMEQKQLKLARIIACFRERYIIKNSEGEYEAELLGSLRFNAQSTEELPITGDWVSAMVFDEKSALIHSILPRKTVIKRKAAGRKSSVQLIAANVDYAFIVQSANRDFNLNRIERYIALCNESGIIPLLVLSKIDLLNAQDIAALETRLSVRFPHTPQFLISNVSGAGLQHIMEVIKPGKTYCMLGSSGVGKSTIINSIAGTQLMQTKTIGQGTDRGKHTTTHREMIILENGGLFIDNPGMREVGMVENSGGIADTFGSISEFASSCKFANCSHTQEKGCAVLEAVEQKIIDEATYQNFLKLKKEQQHYESSVVEKRRNEKKFSKMVKQAKKIKKGR